jgi:hypothetical protein
LVARPGPIPDRGAATRRQVSHELEGVEAARGSLAAAGPRARLKARDAGEATRAPVRHAAQALSLAVDRVRADAQPSSKLAHAHELGARRGLLVHQLEHALRHGLDAASSRRTVGNVGVRAHRPTLPPVGSGRPLRLCAPADPCWLSSRRGLASLAFGTPTNRATSARVPIGVGLAGNPASSALSL